MRERKPIYCKNCKYKTEDRIHGHGEYFGYCLIAQYLLKRAGWDTMCRWTIKSDESKCGLEEFMYKNQ